jgi:hypothetical protein
MINVWIGIQIGSELFARWAEKKYLEYQKKQEEKAYGKDNSRSSNRPARLPGYLKNSLGIRRNRIDGRKQN